VYFSSDVEQALRQWQGLQGGGKAYLFPSRLQRKQGQPLTPRLIQLLLKRYCQSAQIATSYTPHNLRHSFAT
ncbi:tyrosine-type recombinase/integrase, partial [Methylobacterium crusticola]|uniref:tyrosine-type recombinase/integrase n=1 Tax=Methylobacterium crusticola TaxID=1697972 RepID=UPI001EE2BF74